MANEKITVVAVLTAKKGKEEELEKQCLLMVQPTRHEAGCISYDFHQDTENPCSFMFYENWRSKGDLDLHVQKPHSRQFFGLLDELLTEPLKVSIWKKLS